MFSRILATALPGEASCISRVKGRKDKTRVVASPTPSRSRSPGQGLPPGPGDPFHFLRPCVASEQPVLGANEAAPSSGRET